MYQIHGEGVRGVTPATSIADVRYRKLDSFANRLQRFFPDQSVAIQIGVDALIGSIHQEALAVNASLGQINLPPLSIQQLNLIELFYQLKLEKQLRGYFYLSVKKIVYRHIQGIEASLDKFGLQSCNIPTILQVWFTGSTWYDNT